MVRFFVDLAAGGQQLQSWSDAAVVHWVQIDDFLVAEESKFVDSVADLAWEVEEAEGTFRCPFLLFLGLCEGLVWLGGID